MDLIRSDGGSLLRKTVACVSAMTLGTAMLLPSIASAQGRGERGEGEVARGVPWNRLVFLVALFWAVGTLASNWTSRAGDYSKARRALGNP